MSSAYINVLDVKEYRLGSLIGQELSKIGLQILKIDNKHMLDAIQVQFNTLIRFAIKDGIRSN